MEIIRKLGAILMIGGAVAMLIAPDFIAGLTTPRTVDKAADLRAKRKKKWIWFFVFFTVTGLGLGLFCLGRIYAQ